ncbi:hypothetical protein NQ314_020830 [Rhamnusium bicolor]|uniref:Uncharacterized protein n=1 Tax=Rhamnusium bicolor TaxID=1586634 RepID=A0AAV8WKM5_9CUCU|nr:hypothetical protein NQ314_020830 [Rhamnusium bicolor]
MDYQLIVDTRMELKLIKGNNFPNKLKQAYKKIVKVTTAPVGKLNRSAPPNTSAVVTPLLNGIQYIGATIQNDLMSIILRFRLHKIVVFADVAKIYRIVLVDPNQRSL